ncbi:MAG: metal-dependent hydrolase [Flavobacteriales bacterium]|nr:metal-dependent hydrolase [Flavobacteriales bacterium]
MRITYYGHSCFGVHVDGQDLLFDPFVSGNEAARHIQVDTIPASIVLLTHGHGDHVADAQRIADRTGATLISNYEIASWFSGKGVKDTIGMNTGGTVLVDRIQIKFVWAAHSSQLPDGSYGGNPGGFVVRTSEGAYYNAGDTALHMDMQLLAEEQPRFAFLPIGDHFTMGVADAIRAAEMVGVRQVIGIHYNTFPPITIDMEAAVKAFSDRSITLHLPAIGSTIEL